MAHCQGRTFVYVVIFAVSAALTLILVVGYQASDLVNSIMIPKTRNIDSGVLFNSNETRRGHVHLTQNMDSLMISAKEMRETMKENPGAFLGTGNISKYFTQLSLFEAQMLFHGKIIANPFKCNKIERIGKKGDGGYDVCMDEPFKFKANDCLVYSFGVRNDWSFDDQVNQKYGCEVHSFDPSINMDDHVHKEPNMFFHNLGLWGSNLKNDLGWELRDLETIVQLLNHQDRVIDYLKVDIEGAEWPFAAHFVQSSVHTQVKQMALEIHTPRLLDKKESMSLLDYGEIHNAYHALDRVQFATYMYHANNGCCGRFSLLTPASIAKRNLCCYETFFINKKYLK